MWVESVVGSPACSERFFSGYNGFPLSFNKNQHFQIPIRSGTHGHVSTSSCELLSDPWVNKLQFTIFLQFTIYNLQIQSFRIQLKRNLPIFDELNEMG